MEKKLFDEYYTDPMKVVNQLQDYMMKTRTTPAHVAREAEMTTLTIIRILKGKNKMFLSTWCKLKRYMADKI